MQTRIEKLTELRIVNELKCNLLLFLFLFCRRASFSLLCVPCLFYSFVFFFTQWKLFISCHASRLAIRISSVGPHFSLRFRLRLQQLLVRRRVDVNSSRHTKLVLIFCRSDTTNTIYLGLFAQSSTLWLKHYFYQYRFLPLITNAARHTKPHIIQSWNSSAQTQFEW